ncbi:MULTISPECIES: trimeric intracellular cation channel family protein [Legionella]|uniref:Trimeric intracellular cation channel family protein n=1 Tax=Legionella septentrionalis TaxID=2498109 RepID=A0A433JLH7_9GAMM|nr:MULTISPECIES: trimeric intracellular cation channel family protein [Legionella]MCP0914557.1 trimeric intracellular cation channel family protein [Legionella sp. 27cVA30]RUQ90022.1 trimeric intracellular cation channel family protein [Legionella septentrionalis]RUQ93495.1 trimeric intracellular cation channel family protein [Legionella septentrionalis]RUR11202.1 trimeric intracellular cation channel family protein [Legionella septentrionalis]RUR14381.1 trimeric intracellular cation channel f
MVLHYLFIIGICVEAITGAIAAGRKKMDFFGVMLIASVTALGGGTVRDVLFNTPPLTWIAHPHYLLYTCIAAFLTIFVAHSLVRIMKVFLILDALGLAAFVILGTQKILTFGMSPIVAVIGGMITGISGGMLRDILCNDIPLVLRKELYAVIALAGALLFIILDYLNIPENINIVITLSCIFITRVLAIIFHIEIPKFDFANSLRKRS